MNRTEFIEILRSQLAGQMHEGRAAAHVRYYEDYIQSQIRGGRTEVEVLAELGDPRLIAKTLIDTNTDDGPESYEDYQSYAGDYSGPGQEQNPQVRKRKIDLSTWYGKALVVICAIAVVAGLVTIIGTILPFVLVFALIIYFLSWFKKHH